MFVILVRQQCENASLVAGTSITTFRFFNIVFLPIPSFTIQASYQGTPFRITSLKNPQMTRDSIEDYLYFFWAPLLKEGTLNPDDIDAFQEMIILTLSQAAVYIEAPEYIAGVSSREFPDEIKNEITAFGDKIFSNIPARGTDNALWLKITTVPIVPIEVTIIDMHLEMEQSFGPFKISGEKYLTFDFFSVAFQLQLRLPMVAGVSAVISTKVPFAITDGPVAEIDIPDCTVWLSAIDIDQGVADASLYAGVRLKQCVVSFDPGYTKSGNLISAGLIDLRAGFSVTCLAADEAPLVEPGVTVAAGNALAYPGKFVFTCKNQAGLPQPPKIILTHAESFSGVLFGSTVTTSVINETTGSWVPEKRMLSFSLQTEEGIFSATENASRVFDLKGEGTISDPAWYFVPVSINHPLALGRLGIASESGYLGFDIRDACRLSWDGLENGPVKLKQFFLRTSPDTLVITYTSSGNLLAKQELQLWKAVEKQKGRSRVHLSYTSGGGGNFISHRRSKEQHTTSAAMDLDIDRPLLSNGERVFLQTAAKLMLIHNQAAITAVIIGEKMDPAAAFESSAYKRLSSFALANALILVNPVELFLLVAQLDGSGIARSGQCILTLPVFNIEHTLPDPYITSLFNDQPLANDNVQPTRGLRVSVSWLEPDEAALIMQLCDESGNVFTPKGSITDEQLADHLLQFPLPHPGETIYDTILDQSVMSAGNIEATERPDNATYGSYQSSYHSKTNTTGAFSMLHMLPGNASLVDVSGRASQMGVSFSRRLDNAEQGILAVLANTGYTMNQTFRIVNNELVSSGRFVRAFTLPQVQWEPVYFERKSDLRTFFSEENPFATHGVPTRISSANKEDVTLAPVPVTSYVVNSFLDDKNKYAAAAHFALPFGMNSVALFHPMVADVVLPRPENLFRRFMARKPDPYSYSIMNFNQPAFLLKSGPLSGAIQIKVLSEGYPDVPRDNLPDPSFHGAVLQTPEGFNVTIDPRLQQVISGVQTATALLPQFLITPENANFSFLKNTAGNLGTLIQCHGDSILGATITDQFNKQMWGEQAIESIQVDKVNRKAFITFAFTRSVNAKVPLRRIDFSGLGASIFSNWL
ncbi:MAG TPA: hypothetical protein VFV68_10570, partial [Agriterribacter sp.]|nr:hypothetical protein [Agriterribacter sp.]